MDSSSSANSGSQNISDYRIFHEPNPSDDTVTEPASLPLRLGLDYGTCWSKMLLWQPGVGGPGRAVVVRPEQKGADYRVPSRVVWLGGRLYFGIAAKLRATHPGAVSYPSLKARLFDPEGFAGLAPPCPEGLSVADLVTLSMAPLIDLGLRRGRRLAGEGVAIEVVLGAPMGPAEEPRFFEVMEKVGGVALAMARRGLPELGEGLSPQQARTLLEEAAMAHESVTVIPELDAALAWFHQSPWVPPGRYALADVGAGFSRAACFEVEPGPAPRTKGALRCFGVVHRIIGADAIDAALAQAAGVADATVMRGDEGTLIVRHRGAIGDEIRRVMESVFDVYRQAHTLAYQRDATSWGDYALVLAGGGSWIRVIREHLLSPAQTQLAMGPSLLNAGKPDGLYEIDGRPFYGDPDFLITAYGLGRCGVPSPSSVAPDTDLEALWAGAGRGSPSGAPPVSP